MIPSIFALAGPTMLEQFMHTAVQYIDTAMVGSLGTSATAAVGATSTVNWLIGSTVSAVSIGFLSFVAQARGAGRYESARKASSQAILAVLFLGILFTVIPLALSGAVPVWMQVDEAVRPLASKYFFIIYTPMLFRAANIIFSTLHRAVGDTKTPMKIGIIVNIVNVVLNFILIYDDLSLNLFGKELNITLAGLGVIGAAIASAIAYTVGGVLITLSLFRNKDITPKGYSIRPDPEILKPCLKVATPSAFQMFGTSLGYVAFASMVNSLGECSTAAHTIANTVESAFYIPGYGMQSATATLVGNAYGAKDENKIRELSRTIIFLEVVMMIVSGGLLFIFADSMMSIFSSDREVIELGARVLRLVALSEPFYGVSIVIEGMLHGCGRTGYSFICSITGMWLIRILGTFICINLLSLGLVSAWACMIMHNLSLFCMFLIYYKSGHWKKKMLENDNKSLQTVGN